jgi:arabinose-5-phosphate isomerase
MSAVLKPAAPQSQSTQFTAGESHGALRLAREVLRIESEAVAALGAKLDHQFIRAVDLLLGCTGRVVVSGIGKSGHIARKIAATFASTGTPAFFVHPAEASHGDLGMVTSADVMVAFSYSGETAELLTIVPLIKREGAKLIAITGAPQSSLATLADAHLDASVTQEACPLNLAPTASTTAALAMGDALAVACLDAKGFGAQDFARSHPGGALGRKLLTKVRDVMHAGDAVPCVDEHASLFDAIVQMTQKQMGMTAVLRADGSLAGIFTDGNLRRALEGSASHAGNPDKISDIRQAKVSDYFSAKPLTINADALAAEALALMEKHAITQLIVSPDGCKLEGALNMQDLFRAKVV